MAWIPDIDAKSAIAICRAFFDMGVEAGELERKVREEKGQDFDKMQMGLYPDTVRVSRVGNDPRDYRPAFGYRFITRNKNQPGRSADRYFDGYVIGFHFAIWG